MVKQVKSVEKAIDEVINGKTQNLHITLTLQARQEAIAALKARGLDIRENFDGPLFEDIAGYTINGEWVGVMLKDGATYVYPKTSIARVKHFNKE